MKSIFTALLSICFYSAVYAQCNAFFPMKENVRYEYDHFDKKEKLSFKMTHTMKNITGSENNMGATLVQDIFDAKKGDKTSTSELDWKCENGTLHFDMKSMNLMMDNGQQMNMGDGGMTVDITGDKMDLPSGLSVGQTFKDVAYNIKMTMSGMTLMNRTFNIKERKVEAQENVTTPAGIFNCYKVTFIVSSEKGGVGSGSTKSAIWYANDAGLVKAENYKDDGKLMNRQVLTRIVK